MDVVKLPQGLTVWRRLWPIAVEVTNAAQPPDAGSDLNIVARASDAREPMDLDTLNLPTGKLLDVFLVACPNVRRGTILLEVTGSPVRCAIRSLPPPGGPD
jgi:hypothetical protein